MEDEKMLNMENIIPIEKRGRPRKENKNEIVPVSMPKDLKDRLANDEEAKKNRSAFICKILYEYYSKIQ